MATVCTPAQYASDTSTHHDYETSERKIAAYAIAFLSILRSVVLAFIDRIISLCCPTAHHAHGHAHVRPHAQVQEHHGKQRKKHD
jgi:hypothetical protein